MGRVLPSSNNNDYWPQLSATDRSLNHSSQLTKLPTQAALADEPAVAFPASIAALMKLTFA